MKAIGLLIVLAAACLWVVPSANAAEEGKKSPADRRAKILERFDADQDGKLSDDERGKARDAVRDRLGEGGGRRPGGPGPAGRPDREELLKKFDADGDGKLSDDERAKAREELRKRLGEGGGKGPGKRPGGPGPAGRPNREELLKKFDADGDGKLSDDERAKAREGLRKRAGDGRRKPAPKAQP